MDGDGLVESPYRLGISGQYQWATGFYDVISFGWKCTFSNALLYSALRTLARVLPRLGRPAMAEGLDAWADRLKASYLPAFLNPATGWLAGWRCKEGKLHDHAFITINGAAVATGVVDIDAGRDIMKRIWKEAMRLRASLSVGHACKSLADPGRGPGGDPARVSHSVTTRMVD